MSSQCPPISSKNLKTLQPLQIKETEVFRGQNAGKRFKIKGKQLPSTSVQRLFSAVYRPDSLNSSKSSGGDTVRVRPPLPAPYQIEDDTGVSSSFFCPKAVIFGAFFLKNHISNKKGSIIYRISAKKKREKTGIFNGIHSGMHAQAACISAVPAL